MYRISNFRKGACFIIVAMFLFTSCKQSPTNNLVNDDDLGSGYASDASRIELANDDVISIADAAGLVYNAAYIGNIDGTGIGNCASVGTDTISNPHTLTIRYGNTDCKCLDGRNRKGTIIVYYTGQYTDAKTIHTITFDNYYINDNQLTGSIETERIDTTITGNWYYNVQVNDSMNMSQDPLKSQFVIIMGNLVRKWVSGFATGDRSDDVFSVSGSATLTRPNTHVYSLGISTPLQVALGCDYVESGVVDVTGYQGARTLNYGNGSCDALAQLNIGVTVSSLTLLK